MRGVFFASWCGRQIRRWEVVSGAVGWAREQLLDVPLVPGFEEALLGGPGE
jgi:hypothetical protein